MANSVLNICARNRFGCRGVFGCQAARVGPCVKGIGEMDTALKSPPDRSRIARDPQRSRITNGSALLPGVDGRSGWVRRCKDVIATHLSDIPDASAAERSIIRRASVLTVELERLEVKFATAGEASPDEIDLYARVAGNLRRLLEAVGLQRRAREVVADPLTYAREHAHLNGDDA